MTRPTTWSCPGEEESRAIKEIEYRDELAVRVDADVVLRSALEFSPARLLVQTSRTVSGALVAPALDHCAASRFAAVSASALLTAALSPAPMGCTSTVTLRIFPVNLFS